MLIKQPIGIERTSSDTASRLYLKYSAAAVASSMQEQNGTLLVEFDAAGNVVGLEVLGDEAPTMNMALALAQHYGLETNGLV
jgi:uncharacterized protein YuzE